MKIKTNELTGAALDWVVAQCEKVRLHPSIQAHGKLEVHFSQPLGCLPYSPSTDWSQGGPIIEREQINLVHHGFDGDSVWWAAIGDASDEETLGYSGLTPLIAAMRCFVASKLGNEVDVSEELL
jgi:hypothetical protein